MAIAILGDYKSSRHQEAVKEFYDWERWYRDALAEPYREMIEHQRLYLSKRRDHRKPWEKTWRALTLQPYPYLIVEGQVAAVSDVINASDPLVQAEGVGDEDIEIARKVERLLDLTFRMNQWRLMSELLVRESAILGTAAVKVTWRHDTSKVREYNPEEEAEYVRLKEQFQAFGEQMPDDPDGYQEWSRDAEAKFGLAGMPRHPSRMVRDVTTFQGPSYDRISIFDLRFDPLQPRWSDQRKIAQRIVKTKKWVLDNTGDDDRFPFDPEAVASAIDVGITDGAARTGGFNQWQQEIAQMLGLATVASGYPVGRDDLVEVFEVFDNDDEEAPYKVVLNRHAIINKDPGGMPYGHGECPIHLIRNVPVPSSALGLSTLKAPKSLFYELWSLRDLRLDNITLNTLPVYQKLNEMGIPDVAKVFQPGGTLSLPRLDAIKKLDLGSVHPDVWREVSEIKLEIDDASSVPTNLRGQAATVGRVSAAESEQRFSSAMLRMKTQAVRFEEEIKGLLRQSLYLWYQHGDPELLIRAGGPGTDAYSISVSKEELAHAIDMDFNFRGPSRIMNRDMLVQQMLQWFGTFQQLLKPSRQLMAARQVYELMGLKNRSELLPDEDIMMAIQAENMPPAPPQAAPGAPPEAGGAEGQPAPAEVQSAPQAAEAPPQ